MAYWDLREAVKKQFPVSAGHDPFVEDRQYAPVGVLPYESSQTLLEGDYGGWDLIFKEGVASSVAYDIDPCSDQRLTRGVKGQFVDNEAAECLARHIYPLPEGACGQEDRMDIVSELIQEYRPGGIALSVDRVWDLVP